MTYRVDRQKRKTQIWEPLLLLAVFMLFNVGSLLVALDEVPAPAVVAAIAMQPMT